MPITIDPNVIYVLLLLSLWASVTAAFMPGTGIVEVLAGLGMVASVVVLAMMPTNWLSVIALIVGGLGFFIIPFINPNIARFSSIGGIALQMVGGLTLFSQGGVSVALILVVTAISLAYYRFGLLNMLETQRAKAALIDDEGFIGAIGTVQRALDPVGVVRVHGESWTARSDRRLEPGETVIVRDVEGLTLIVEGEKHKREALESIEEAN